MWKNDKNNVRFVHSFAVSSLMYQLQNKLRLNRIKCNNWKEVLRAKQLCSVYFLQTGLKLKPLYIYYSIILSSKIFIHKQFRKIIKNMAVLSLFFKRQKFFFLFFWLKLKNYILVYKSKISSLRTRYYSKIFNSVKVIN